MENLTIKELEALRYIRNTVMNNGRFPGVREMARGLKYKSPRSAAVLLEQLLKKKAIKKRKDGSYTLLDQANLSEMSAQTVDVPLVGTAACGLPILAEQNVEAMISVSARIVKPPHKYFILKAKGASMDKKGINDGDLVLVRQQNVAENGDLVVALIDDEATIKELQFTPEMIVLKPHTTEPEKHQPIILTRDFMVQGIVVSVIPFK